MIPPPPRSTLFPYTTLFRSLPEDVLLHLRVPSLGLVAEVYSGLQQLLHRQRRHASSFGLPPPRFVGSPRTAGTRSQARLAYGCGSPCGPARSNGPHYHRKRAACVMVTTSCIWR